MAHDAVNLRKIIGLIPFLFSFSSFSLKLALGAGAMVLLFPRPFGLSQCCAAVISKAQLPRNYLVGQRIGYAPAETAQNKRGLAVRDFDVGLLHRIDEVAAYVAVFPHTDEFLDSMAEMAIDKVAPVILRKFTNLQIIAYKNRRRIERRNVVNRVAIDAIKKSSVAHASPD